MKGQYWEAHLIGGPHHGSTVALHTPLQHYRVAAPPQGDFLRSDEAEAMRITLKTGTYTRSAPLRFDPITHKMVRGEPSRFVYEWTGWES